MVERGIGAATAFLAEAVLSLPANVRTPEATNDHHHSMTVV